MIIRFLLSLCMLMTVVFNQGYAHMGFLGENGSSAARLVKAEVEDSQLTFLGQTTYVQKSTSSDQQRKDTNGSTPEVIEEEQEEEKNDQLESLKKHLILSQYFAAIYFTLALYLFFLSINRCLYTENPPVYHKWYLLYRVFRI